MMQKKLQDLRFFFVFLRELCRIPFLFRNERWWILDTNGIIVRVPYITRHMLFREEVYFCVEKKFALPPVWEQSFHTPWYVHDIRKVQEHRRVFALLDPVIRRKRWWLRLAGWNVDNGRIRFAITFESDRLLRHHAFLIMRTPLKLYMAFAIACCLPFWRIAYLKRLGQELGWKRSWWVRPCYLYFRGRFSILKRITQ